DRAIEIAALRHDGDLRAGADGIAHDVDAADERPATGWAHSRRQHADRRCLAGSVRPEQSEHLAPSNGERDAVDGVHLRLRVALLEQADLCCGVGDHGCGVPTRPDSYATITAWTRSRSCSFCRMRLTCVFTVDSSMTSSAAIS